MLKVRINMLLLISLPERLCSACTFTVPAYNQLSFNEGLKCPNLLKIIKNNNNNGEISYRKKIIKYVLLKHIDFGCISLFIDW